MQIKNRFTQANIADVPSAQSTALSDFPESLQRVLMSRGVTKKSQIDYSLKQLLPPSGLLNVEMAADLLSEAISANAKIIIVGDFDVDGASSVALTLKCLKAFGHNNASYIVPNRFEFGYGLSPEIVGVLAAQQPDLIITVDNGISSIDGVHAAQQLGMTVMITDHHLPGDALPTADVIVNPNLPNDAFASKHLAGVGVIFYVLLATRATLRQINWFKDNDIIEPNMSQFLDLVALGTVADLVSLDFNNRILVQQGMHRIRQGKACLGIQSLLQIGKKQANKTGTNDLAFAVAPRLNAAGRMDDMSIGIECLLADDEQKAMSLSQQLDNINQHRKQVEQEMKQDARAIINDMSLQQEDPPFIYMLHDASWHQGVVGLVASMVKEQTHRPALVLAPDEGGGNVWKGSLRSVDGLHIRDLLARVDSLYPNLILKYGGHAMAAGLSVKEDNLGALEQALHKVSQEFCRDMTFDEVILSDGELDQADFNQEFAEFLRELTPWGQHFPEPVFDGEFEIVQVRIVGEKHLKLQLRLPNSQLYLDAIYFFFTDAFSELPNGVVRAVFQLDVNEFRQQKSLQLIVRNLLPCS